jgi:predicted transcriptional regulator
MPTSRKRSQSIKVTVTPELHERLREVAAQLGQAPATCASMAVSLWVAQQARTLDAGRSFVEDMAKQVGPELVEQMRLAFAKGDA